MYQSSIYIENLLPGEYHNRRQPYMHPPNWMLSHIQAVNIYFQKAAELGDANSMFELGKLYHRAEVVNKDDVLAQAYLQQAIIRGNNAAVIYFDDNYFKLKDRFLNALEKLSETLDKEYQKAKLVPYITPNKERRNDLCACGSGEKYKKCHGVG